MVDRNLSFVRLGGTNNSIQIKSATLQVPFYFEAFLTKFFKVNL